jgi:hypothetical protein
MGMGRKKQTLKMKQRRNQAKKKARLIRRKTATK